MIFTPEQCTTAYTIGKLVGYEEALKYLLRLTKNQHLLIKGWGFVLCNNELWWYSEIDGKVTTITKDALSSLSPSAWLNYVKYVVGDK